MIDLLADGSLVDFGSLGAGGAFGAGVVVALNFVQKWRQNGTASSQQRDDFRFLIDQASKRHARIVECLNQLNASQARMATLLEVLVQKTCQTGLAKGAVP